MILNIILGIIILVTVFFAVKFKHDGNMIEADRDYIKDTLNDFMMDAAVKSSKTKSVKASAKKTKKKAKQMEFTEYSKLVSIEAAKINPDIKLSERDIRECFNSNIPVDKAAVKCLYNINFSEYFH